MYFLWQNDLIKKSSGAWRNERPYICIHLYTFLNWYKSWCCNCEHNCSLFVSSIARPGEVGPGWGRKYAQKAGVIAVRNFYETILYHGHDGPFTVPTAWLARTASVCVCQFLILFWIVLITFLLRTYIFNL